MQYINPFDRAREIPLSKIRAYQKMLLAWFDEHKRNFPWRETNNPYYILISELLLQKTNSRAVGNVFQRFIKEFPTPSCVNAKNRETVYEIISPLGLFYRTERILNICQSIENEFNGKIPNTLTELMALKGVGRYAASAVLCFGFSKRTAILDQNVIRILSRLFAINSAKSRPRDDNDLWQAAIHLVPEKNYKKYNYALLDFSAKVCRTTPLCNICPFIKFCHFYSLT